MSLSTFINLIAAIGAWIRIVLLFVFRNGIPKPKTDGGRSLPSNSYFTVSKSRLYGILIAIFVMTVVSVWSVWPKKNFEYLPDDQLAVVSYKAIC